MKETLKVVLDEAKGLLYEDTSMALDLICEKLYYEYKLNATFNGRSIYINDVRVASIKTCKEGANIVGIYDYTIL